MKQASLFLFLFCFCSSLFSQDKYVDSVNTLYREAASDTQKIRLLKQLALHFHAGAQYNQSIDYYERIAKVFGEKNKLAAIDATNDMAFDCILLGTYAKADSILQKSLAESQKINYPKGMGNAYRNLALLHVYNGEFSKATNRYLQALAIWEKMNDGRKLAMGYSDLGLNFYYQENYEKAVYYWEMAIKTEPDKTVEYYFSNCSNLGQAYIEMGRYDEAIVQFKKALEFYEKNKQSTGYTNALTGLANVEYKRHHYDNALEYYREIIKLRESAASRSSDLAVVYLNASVVYLDMGKNAEALDYGLRGLEKARESDDKNEQLHAYNNLNSVYAKLGNYEKAYEFSQLYNVLRDSLADIESKKQINELDKKYQTEKKEKDNQLLNKQLEIKQIEGRQQQLYLIISVVVLVMIGFVAAILFRQNKQKQETNRQLEEKSKIIEEQHKDITDSIIYAQRIQQAILPPDKMWYELLPDSFVLYRPKDILSGDFYWIERKQGHVFFAAADCTGHGVPGALMSVVNTNLLNKAVLEQNLVAPNQILDAVNQWLTIALHQSFNESAVRDGMDIALCSINIRTKHLQFAGAFNGAYVYKKDGTFTEINGDKMPVGAFIEEKMQMFTSTELAMEPGDRIFLFSDGYADQFGGPSGKKLKYKKLKEYISESLSLTMSEQKNYLDQKFTEWKGKHEQVDDVLIVGVSV